MDQDVPRGGNDARRDDVAPRSRRQVRGWSTTTRSRIASEAGEGEGAVGALTAEARSRLLQRTRLGHVRVTLTKNTLGAEIERAGN